jgi:hypothetical protein
MSPPSPFDDRSPTFGMSAPRNHGERKFTALVHVYAVVCRSGMAETNRWIAESHNVPLTISGPSEDRSPT